MTREKCITSTGRVLNTKKLAHVALAGVMIAAASLAVQADTEPTVQYQWLMDEDPGWSMDGEWEFGTPYGLGGDEFGNPDPTSGYTGDNVCGMNLYGDYSIEIGGPYYLTAGPIDMTGVAGSSLRFWRWLNVDWLPWVSVKIEASNDNINWVTLWENAFEEIADDAWNQRVLDISAVADAQPTVWIRWSHEVLTGGTWAYSGWNIDDVEILGITPAPGDFDGDGDVDLSDLATLLAIYNRCAGDYGYDSSVDLDASGCVDLADLATLLANYTGIG